MTTILPRSEQLRRALRFIAEGRAAHHGHLVELVEEAARRFDLSPLQEEWLLRLLREPERPGPEPE